MKFATKTRDKNDNKIKKPLLYGICKNVKEIHLKENHHLSIKSTPSCSAGSCQKISGKHFTVQGTMCKK